MTPPTSSALLLSKMQLIKVNNPPDVSMTSVYWAAVLLVKVLLMIVNDTSNVYMTPPHSAKVLCKELLIILTVPLYVNMTPPIYYTIEVLLSTPLTSCPLLLHCYAELGGET